MDIDVQAVHAAMRRVGARVKYEWVQACVSFLRQQGVTSSDAVTQGVYQQMLTADLSDCADPFLSGLPPCSAWCMAPQDVSRGGRQPLFKVSFQGTQPQVAARTPLKTRTNMSVPLTRQSLPVQGRDGVRLEEPMVVQITQIVPRQDVLSLDVSDGHTPLSLVLPRAMHVGSLSHVVPGAKVCVPRGVHLNGVLSASGAVLLLGGYSKALIAKHSQELRLRQREETDSTRLSSVRDVLQDDTALSDKQRVLLQLSHNDPGVFTPHQMPYRSVLVALGIPPGQ
ncbi:hypothetical protein KIPB_012419 [Kipferlia bialata]|uniref:RMI1 N-terminal domain-containing protein n=1 Tax=Kipferlia bialata TaxID=797122 RepID=A0A391NV86_9EUKA|nr:hypothetical protein KIPB_012419 [Kipferlia bialata]|eukprot:g12419.t1